MSQKDVSGPEPFRVVELRARNFMRLQAIEIRPDGALVQITGANENGKTSVIKAIAALLEGKAAAPPVTIRRGETECILEGDFGRFKVHRKITQAADGGESWGLTVTADGRKIAHKPQTFLDGKTGIGLSFDPLEFARWDAKRQADVLKGLVSGFDFAANAKARLAAFTARTDENRIAARESAAAQLVKLPAGPRPAPIDVTDLAARMSAATAHNETIQKRLRGRQKAQDDIDQKSDEAERLRAAAAALEAEAHDLTEKLTNAEPLPALMDVDGLRQQMVDAGTIMAAASAFTTRDKHEAAAAAAQAEAQRLSGEIVDLDQAKAGAIASAALPVPGLSLGDDLVLLDGLPFAQASTARRIKTSMAIAMALAPEARIVLIDEGSELDSHSLQAVADMAEAAGFQVWICRVDESGQQGFVIEDGRVASS